MHCAVRPEDLARHRDKWNVVFEALSAASRAQPGTEAPNRGMEPTANDGG
jgi:hypothetical protein